MLVEFSELLDRTELCPAATNMTVEAMPNDNLVRNSKHHLWGKMLTHISPRSYILLYFQLLSGELTFTLNFKMRLSRPVRDEMILREGNVRKYQKLSKLNLNLLLRVAASHQQQDMYN